MVRLAGPPPPRPIQPLSAVVRAGERLVRIYKPARLEPNGFNHNGPRSRFDHHQATDEPRDDPDRGIYYAAPTLAGCVVEVFGDSGVISPAGYRVALVELARDLRVLDLTGDGAWRAGSVAALTKDADRVFTQRWARHFYEDTSTYGVLDGLKYENAHDAALAYALFERAGSMTVVMDVPLSDPKLEAELATIARGLGLVID